MEILSNFDKSIETLFSCMDVNRVWSTSTILDFSKFDGADPLWLVEDATYNKINPKFQMDDIKLKDIPNKLDIVNFFKGADSRISIERFTQISDVKKIRDITKGLYMPIVIEFSAIYFDLNKKDAETTLLYVGSSDGENWNLAGGGHTNFSKKELRDHFKKEIKQATWLQFCNYYESSILIKKGNFPAIRFYISSDSAKEFFKLRDIPENKRRREMLVNWVCEHYRKKPNNTNEFNLIQEHFRGTTHFNWLGYECTIIPSAYDLQRYKKLKEV